MRLALVLPPLTQLNTPYPSTAYLARFLKNQGIECTQRDFGIELIHRLFCPAGLQKIFETLEQQEALPEPAWRALSLRETHTHQIGTVMRFLQGIDRTAASRLVSQAFLPEGPRLAGADLSSFGPMGIEDAARHLATLHLQDLVDLVTACIDPGLEFSRYHHHLAAGPASFDPIANRLLETTLVDAELDALTDTLDAEVVGISVPFPGNLYGALRIGRRLKEKGVHVVLGGGYISTELRDTPEERLFECTDALVYDDGEGPLLAFLNYLETGEDQRHRTRTIDGLHNEPASPTATTFAASYGDLDTSLYLQLIDTQNSAHRLWADGRWNKITLAHGCYWKRCEFCDISLDYISRFEPAQASRLADAIEELIEQTGVSGFHFVDEAAPPRAMRDLALEILSRNLSVSWWGNIRFEPTFTPDLCRLLAASGLVAVTGGLEVASDRLLQLMDKGVTIDSVTQSASAFRQAGVLVHAYLMYGFPTQTAQETVDSLEVVRQMFAAGVLNSAFWHRFVLTRHSGVFQHPDDFSIQIEAPLQAGFAQNDLGHSEPGGLDHSQFDEALPAALAEWMRGESLDVSTQHWIPQPPTTVTPNRIANTLESPLHPEPSRSRLIWLGGVVLEGAGSVVLHHSAGEVEVQGSPDELAWVSEVIEAAHPRAEPLLLLEAIEAFPGDFETFEPQWHSIRSAGLVAV